MAKGGGIPETTLESKILENPYSQMLCFFQKFHVLFAKPEYNAMIFPKSALIFPKSKRHLKIKT